jgi:peroxiredoxin
LHLMTALTFIARLLLAATFGIAGGAKLLDRAGSRQALQDFGFSSAIARPLGILLPLTELAVAMALLASVTAWWGAVSALALLILFLSGICWMLAQGRKPACRCFGQLSSAPIGWTTLIRNASLAAIAGLLVWQGPRDIGAGTIINQLQALTAVQLGGLAIGVFAVGLLALGGWLLLHLMRQHGRLLLRMDQIEARLTAAGLGPIGSTVSGLAIGTPAPAFELPDVNGKLVALVSLYGAGRPVLLIFGDPDCAPCSALFPEIAKWQRSYFGQLTIAVISRGAAEINRDKIWSQGVPLVLLQNDREVMEGYQVTGTPSAVLVNPDGTIGSMLAVGSEMIVALMARTVSQPLPLPRPAPAQALPVGSPAPAVTLRGLTGEPIELSAFHGRPTLLLFWNPSCGFCQQMLADLKAWEADAPQGAPQLLVVSTGTVEANQAMGLRSPIALDEGFSAGGAFGTTGTPSAILIDENGHIASSIAIGAQAVLALAAGADTRPNESRRAG